MMKPLNLRELRAVANRRLTCKPQDCQCESDCFRFAAALLQMMPDPLPDEPDEPEDPDAITDYAPDWSEL
jgi:hypothetical protein